jgi:putative CocE/NonD family hydrolase
MNIGLLGKGLLFLLITGLGGLAGSQSENQPEAQKTQRFDLIVPMRDGVHLTADLYLPEAEGRWPTVLVRTPYSRKAKSTRSYLYFRDRGYAVVLEDVRGRFGSGGIFSSVEQEGPDGNDTIDWIAQQPWSNGQVAMAGSSYLGIVQWWAALEDNPHLLAISPMCSGDDEYLDRYYSSGGALQLGHRLSWVSESLKSPLIVRPALRDYIWHLPLRTSDLAASYRPVSLWRTALAHPSDDAYWRRRSVRDQIQKVSVPVLSFGGWFDSYAESDLDAFSRLALQHKPVETWIGPWAHNPAYQFPTRDFGPEASIPIRAKQADWFAEALRTHTLLGHIHRQHQHVLHIFVIGPDIWREEREWPLARTRYIPLYLVSNGRANTASGDGRLKWSEPQTGQADGFTYDPAKPVPTVGGAICCDPRILPPGPLAQNQVERRADVLVYTSEPLGDSIEVTGTVRVTLYVSTSANDTDFTAKLVDVDPNGRALLVTDGIQRLRYRLTLTTPIFAKRNVPYQINVDAGVTSYVFAAGHRLRLEVSSSNFPRFDRNLNSTGANADQTKLTKARQNVFHNPRYPSAVVLPVIPGGR